MCIEAVFDSGVIAVDETCEDSVRIHVCFHATQLFIMLVLHIKYQNT